MRKIKTSALVLLASLALGSGLTVVTADPASGHVGHLALHTGYDRVMHTGTAQPIG